MTGGSVMALLPGLDFQDLVPLFDQAVILLLALGLPSRPDRHLTAGAVQHSITCSAKVFQQANAAAL